MTKQPYKYEVFREDYPINPRTHEYNVCVFAFSHNRCDLGDATSIPFDDLRGWEGVRNYIEKNFDVAAIEPVYMYDHGQIGWAFITKTKLRDLGLMNRNLTKKAIKSAENIIEGEIYEYDSYLRGDIWGYRLSDWEDETVDECWGYLGELSATAAARNAMYEHIKALGPHAL